LLRNDSLLRESSGVTLSYQGAKWIDKRVGNHALSSRKGRDLKNSKKEEKR